MSATEAALSPEVAAALARHPTTHGRVVRSRPLTAYLREVTIGGLHDYPLAGGDEFVHVLVSWAPGGIPPSLTMADHVGAGGHGPGRGAYYTVRTHRPAAGEIDLWVVCHGHAGSVSAWFETARPGDPLALWGPRTGFVPPLGARRLLLVADETGLAATAAVVESLDGAVEITAVLEAGGVADHPPMPAHPGLTVVWASPRQGLLATVRAVVNRSPDAASVAAEVRQVAALRRYLRDGLGLPRSAVHTVAYWRRTD